jgi:hypothetical protein
MVGALDNPGKLLAQPAKFTKASLTSRFTAGNQQTALYMIDEIGAGRTRPPAHKRALPALAYDMAMLCDVLDGRGENLHADKRRVLDQLIAKGFVAPDQSMNDGAAGWYPASPSRSAATKDRPIKRRHENALLGAFCRSIA